jgi:hypothetical protein
MWSAPYPFARQRVAKHVPATRNNSVAMQCAVNTTIEEDVFSMFYVIIQKLFNFKKYPAPLNY